MTDLTEVGLKRFSEWIIANGGEVLAPTSEWELIRVLVRGETFVAYHNKAGKQTWPPSLAELVTRWRNKQHIKLGFAIKLSGNRKARMAALLKRDGPYCWYCGKLDTGDIPAERLTIEEVCARQVGGPAHIKNQVLACVKCNGEAGSLSVVEKVAIRDRKRGYVDITKAEAA